MKPVGDVVLYSGFALVRIVRLRHNFPPAYHVPLPFIIAELRLQHAMPRYGALHSALVAALCRAILHHAVLR